MTTVTTYHNQEFVIPGYTSIVDVTLSTSAKSIIKQNFDELLIKLHVEHQVTQDYYQRHQLNHIDLTTHYTKLNSITNDDLDNLFDYLNGQPLNQKLTELKSHLPYQCPSLMDILLKDDRLFSLAEFNLFHLFRCFNLTQDTKKCFGYSFYDYDIVRNADLRTIAEVIKHINECSIEDAILGYYSAHQWMDKENVWPFFAENIGYLDDSLGFPNHDQHLLSIEARNAIKILSYFPALPSKYIPFLLEIALASTKSLRDEAQQLLAHHQDIHCYAEKALSSNRSEERIVAAKWLAKIAQPSSINVLYHALKYEEQLDVQAAILATLQYLGESIEEYLSPHILLQQSQTGLKSKIPISINWLKRDIIPSLTWQDGSPVDPDIIYWWIIFAVKLKEPKTPQILQCYIKLLSIDSQQRLGLFILKSFIRYDTRTLSLEQAIEKAKENAPRRIAMEKSLYQAHPENYPEYKNIVEQDVIDELTKNYLSYCVDDLAINCRGMLALIMGIQGYHARAELLNYIKQYPSRHKQFRHLLEAISMTDQPLLIQFLHYIARSYQTSSVKKRAQNLLNEIAERNNWNERQFAERILSNINWDKDNQLILNYGTRQFTATLNDLCELVLHNPDGKLIKSLPSIISEDDELLAKQAKTTFTESKKTLKSLVETNTTNLYDSMCLQHRWTVSDWTISLLQHSIINKLINRLIWVEFNPKQQIVSSFRPINLTKLVDHKGNTVKLNPDNYVGLAHSAILDHAICQAWRENIKNEVIIPLFEQFPTPIMSTDYHQQLSIEYNQNIIVDSAVMIKALHQLKYYLTSPSIYTPNRIFSKKFKGGDIVINIEFMINSWNQEKESLISADLNFSHIRQDTQKILSIKNVPSIILLEGYSDYQKVLKLCQL